jgi:hypothetical protein
MIGCRFFDSALAKDCVPKKGGPRLVSKVQKSSKKFKKVQKSSKKFKKVQKSSKKFKKVQKSSMHISPVTTPHKKKRSNLAC